MQYLIAAEYVAFGLEADTADDLVTAASAMIDAYCRRPSLGITQYVERVRLSRCSHSVRVSYTPLAAVSGSASALVSVRTKTGRYRADPWYPLADVATVFATSAWTTVDISTIDVAEDGVLCFPTNLFSVPFDEAEITYTAGYVDVPTQIKVACAQIVRNAQATPALTVKRQAMDSIQMEYFSGTLFDADVEKLLAPYVSERVG